MSKFKERYIYVARTTSFSLENTEKVTAKEYEAAYDALEDCLQYANDPENLECEDNEVDWNKWRINGSYLDSWDHQLSSDI